MNLRKKRCAIILAMVVVASILVPLQAEAASWRQNRNGWWWQEDNGSWPAGQWRNIDGTWYAFDTNGYMVSNCYVKSLTEEMYYWINRDGVWETQWDTAQPERGYGVYS